MTDDFFINVTIFIMIIKKISISENSKIKSFVIKAPIKANSAMKMQYIFCHRFLFEIKEIDLSP